MPHNIEHPQAIGTANKAVLDTLTDAYQVALHLASQGHEIKAICAGRCSPQIWINTNGPTHQLDSTTGKRSHDARGRYEIRCTHINGVQVNWIIRASNTERAAA